VFDYQLIRSARRKTLTLQIKHGQMFVRAPQHLSLNEIENFIDKKSFWLKQKLSEQRLRIQNTPHITIDYSQDDKILYLGEEKQLNIKFQSTNDIRVTEHHIDISITQRRKKNIHCSDELSLAVKQSLAALFKEKLEDYLFKKIPELTQKLQLFPINYKVRFYKSRWGSCNSRGELRFNYLLMMTPLWVIDYVIIHELCHLKHLNHSSAFWQLVETYQPNYKQAKTWLKDHQTMLVWR